MKLRFRKAFPHRKEVKTHMLTSVLPDGDALLWISKAIKPPAVHPGYPLLRCYTIRSRHQHKRSSAKWTLEIFLSPLEGFYLLYPRYWNNVYSLCIKLNYRYKPTVSFLYKERWEKHDETPAHFHETSAHHFLSLPHTDISCHKFKDTKI